MKPQCIRLRAATEADSEFCYSVKKEAMGPYVAQVWGWDETFQREFHRADFGLRRPDVVAYQELDIGTLEITRHDDHIHLGEFYLLPQFQRRGIGSFLLQQVLNEASEKGLPVRLEVLKINPVRSLYLRHGFVVTGQREHHFLMERDAQNNGEMSGTNSIKFSSLERADLSECVVLFVNVFNNPPWNESWETEAIAQRLDDCVRTPGSYGSVARIDGKIVGFAIGTIERWDVIKQFSLDEMCVATEKQRHGVGTALLNELEEKLKDRNVARLYLTTARDTSAQSFYEKNGFHTSSKMILMTKRLAEN